MRALFASDLHLSSEDPDKVDLFEQVLEQASTSVDAVYLLGDIFEIWLGDDDLSEPHPRIIDAMRSYRERGGRLHVMSGNRDFLFGAGFVEKTGAELLLDWHAIDLGGVTTLLTHGDLLCTRDVQYQQFRQYVRDPNNQKQFLAFPLAERKQIAANTRSGTKASMLEKEDVIMDVEQSTVEKIMLEHGVNRLIHGHTHRPADHTFTDQNGQQCERLVLGDWYDGCSILIALEGEINRLSATAFAGASA